MRIIDAGHKYEVNSYDGGEPQYITFMKRMGDNYPFNFSKYGGTNCQEILRVLIDRTEYLNKQQPCSESECIISSLKTALLLFEIRALRKREQHVDLTSVDDVVRLQTCNICGHIKCNKNHNE